MPAESMRYEVPGQDLVMEPTSIGTPPKRVFRVALAVARIL